MHPLQLTQKTVWALGCLMNACRSAAFAVCCINILATQPRMISSVDWVVRAGSSLRGTGDAGFLETIDWEKMGEDTGETNANFNQCGFPSFAVANSKQAKSGCRKSATTCSSDSGSCSPK